MAYVLLRDTYAEVIDEIFLPTEHTLSRATTGHRKNNDSVQKSLNPFQLRNNLSQVHSQC